MHIAESSGLRRSTAYLVDRRIRELPIWHLYLLRCADGSLYCGITTNTGRRLRQHQNGTASKYTRCRRPVALVYCEGPYDLSEALRREVAVKKLGKHQKEELCRR